MYTTSVDIELIDTFELRKNKILNRELNHTITSKDKAAVASLYNQYGKKLYGYAVSKWHFTEDEAWDMVYKTLYKVIEVVDKYTFENESKFAGFVFKIFMNNLRMHYRDTKNKKLDTVELSDQQMNRVSGTSKASETNTGPNPQLAILQEELEKLEDWQRILLLMRAQNMSYAAIAVYANKPEEQLKVYYMRLKKMIADKIEERMNVINLTNGNVG